MCSYTLECFVKDQMNTHWYRKKNTFFCLNEENSRLQFKGSKTAAFSAYFNKCNKNYVSAKFCVNTMMTILLNKGIHKNYELQLGFSFFLQFFVKCSFTDCLFKVLMP